MKIALFNTAFFYRDAAVKRSAQSENQAALNLCFDGTGIDRNSAVERNHGATQPHLALRSHFDFHYQANMATKRLAQSNTASDSRRQRALVPADFFRC